MEGSRKALFRKAILNRNSRATRFSPRQSPGSQVGYTSFRVSKTPGSNDSTTSSSSSDLTEDVIISQCPSDEGDTIISTTEKITLHGEGEKYMMPSDEEMYTDQLLLTKGRSVDLGDDKPENLLISDTISSDADLQPTFYFCKSEDGIVVKMRLTPSYDGKGNDDFPLDNVECKPMNHDGYDASVSECSLTRNEDSDHSIDIGPNSLGELTQGFERTTSYISVTLNEIEDDFKALREDYTSTWEDIEREGPYIVLLDLCCCVRSSNR